MIVVVGTLAFAISSSITEFDFFDIGRWDLTSTHSKLDLEHLLHGLLSLHLIFADLQRTQATAARRLDASRRALMRSFVETPCTIKLAITFERSSSFVYKVFIDWTEISVAIYLHQNLGTLKSSCKKLLK